MGLLWTPYSPQMNQICLAVALFGSLVRLSEEVTRRAITSFSEMETEVQPKQDEVDSSLQEPESGDRDGRSLLYWITTTSISTSTRSIELFQRRQGKTRFIYI